MRLIDADKLIDMVESRPKHIAWGREIILDTLRNAPTIEPINEVDLIELRDRLGDCVEYVVRDMLSGYRPSGARMENE